jgi:hypothetical protein
VTALTDSPGTTLLQEVVEAVCLLSTGASGRLTALLDDGVVLCERISGRTEVRAAGRHQVAMVLHAGRGCAVLDTVVCADGARVRFAEPWWRPTVSTLASRFLAVAGCTASMDVHCSERGIAELSCRIGPLPGDPDYVELSVFR